jgi:chromosome segregation ATPase
MPQIEEVQFIHWGSLPSDLVPLAVPGITVAIGPNGAGKTCWLDGLKLLLGVSDLSGERTPGSYIFDGGPTGVPAEKAWLRATFANPVVRGTRHRVFAVAGGGCESAEHVTVICRVAGNTRSYLVLPGRVVWGVEQTLAADMEKLDSQTPVTRWRGPQQYDQLLDRAGVSKALRGVLALPQGETDRLTKETPAGLMRRLLDLTGRQITLDEFRTARKSYETALTAHENARQKFELEQAHLTLLERRVGQHRDWQRTRDALAELDNLLLPAARHFRWQERTAELKEWIAEEKAANQTRADELWDLSEQHGRKTNEQAERTKAFARLEIELEQKEKDKSAADGRCGSAHEAARQARRRLVVTAAAIGTETLVDAQAGVATAEEVLATAVADRSGAVRELVAIGEEASRLQTGGSLAPKQVRQFHRQLSDAGVTSIIVADLLSAPSQVDAALARAALGDAALAVVVGTEDYRHACELATSTDYPWPIVQAGPGAAHGALAAVGGPPEMEALLEYLDAIPAQNAITALQHATLGSDAVTADGMRYGRVISQRRSPDGNLFDPGAREATQTRLRNQSQHVQERLDELDARLPDLRTKLSNQYAVRDALKQLDQYQREFKDACAQLATEWSRRNEAHLEHRNLKGRVTEASLAFRAAAADLKENATQLTVLEQAIANTKNAIEQAEQERLDAELALSQNPLPATFGEKDVLRLEPLEKFEQRRQQIADDESNMERYPDDVRDPVIVSQYADEQARLAEVGIMLDGKQQELERHQGVVEEARRRYDEHVKAVVRLLDTEFGKVCAAAGSTGQIIRVPGDQQYEFGVDIVVAHKAGEEPLSYRNDHHSGGQRTKIAVLLLLAAMSLGGAADLLVVDEPHAHLDATNRLQIAELMRNLSDRVQFILASPTDGKDSDQPEWCDLQLAFLPRLPQETYSPSVRVMSRLDADHLEARFASSELPMI